MRNEQFKQWAQADPYMHLVADFHGRTGDPDVTPTFQKMIDQERYVRARNRDLFGLFRWRYWLDRYYGWSINRLKRLAAP